MKINGRPQSTNIIDTRGRNKKILGDETGQQTSKLETWLNANQPTKRSPRQSPPKRSKKNINRGGKGTRKHSGYITGGGF